MTTNEFIEYILAENRDTLSIDRQDINFNEEELISSFCQMLKRKYKLKIEKWTPNKYYYPDYMFLGGDRGILGYIKFRVVYNVNEAFFYSLQEITKLISRAESELDRPVFLITFVCGESDKCFFFETNEEIKDRIFSDRTAYINGMYKIDTGCTGGIANFLNLLKELKKNNVITH